MDGDDTFEEFERVAMTGAAALSRAAEVLIRAAQDNKVRATAETARVTEDLQRRAEAQAQAAERYYARAVESGWVRHAGSDEVALAWKGAQQWAQVDSDRFAGYAKALNDWLWTECGFDPREAGFGGPDALNRVGADPRARRRRSPPSRQRVEGAEPAAVPVPTLQPRRVSRRAQRRPRRSWTTNPSSGARPPPPSAAAGVPGSSTRCAGRPSPTSSPAS